MLDPIVGRLVRVRGSRSEGSLQGIVTSQSCYARQGRSGVAHMFCHLGRGETACMLSTAGELENDRDAIGVIWPFFDLVGLDREAQWPAP